MLNKISKLLKQVGHEVLLSHLNCVDTEYKTDGSPVTAADFASNDRIIQMLTEQWPQYPVLSEESSVQTQHKALQAIDSGVWVLDPLDGTTNFACGIPYFCISLAFIQNGQLQLGVVYDPNRDELFCAEYQKGASLNGKPLKINCQKETLRSCVAVVDFKRLSQQVATELALTPPYASQRSYGSVALDWCWLAAGRGQLYLHGSMNLWDYAAGLLIFHEAGGVSDNFDGKGVFTPKLEKRSAIAASQPRLLDDWKSVVIG